MTNERWMGESVMAMEQTGSRPPRRRWSTGDGTRNPLVALAIALPVAALLAYAFGGWAQFAVEANTMVQLIGR